jgi:ribosome maturation factor RimP
MADNAALERVHALVAPILVDLGLDLYDLDFGAGLLKVTVDKPGGVDLGDLSLATRLINRELEHHDPVAGNYTLEVSSPGIERSLRRPDHYTRVIGSTVNVRLRDVTNESRRIQGVLVAADDHGITVRSEDDPTAQRTITYEQIDRARTVFVWGPPAKGGARPGQTRTSGGRRPGAAARPDDATTEEVTA